MGTEVLRGNLILPDRVLEGGVVVVADGVIQAVGEDEGRYRVTADYGDGYVAPGFIDIHTHGIAGADTMDATPEALALMAARFAAHGVTAFLPTTMTAGREEILRAVAAVAAYMDAQDHEHPAGARALGLHLEGPWIAEQYKGAQAAAAIVPPTMEMARAVLERANGTLRIVTLAAEIQGADEVIGLLRGAGVAVSLGHSGASYGEALRAVELGASQVTHCYNAMTPLHHREPGLTGAALLLDELTAELIADGVHVHPAAMRLLIRAKGRERVAAITDSMAATELPDGDYALGGQPVLVRRREARLADGTLAGSTLTLDRAVRHLVRLRGVPLHDAVYMATATPAAASGVGARKGRLCPGYDADLALLDRELQPRGVVINGIWLPRLGQETSQVNY